MVVVYPLKRWEKALYSLVSVTPYFALVNLFAGREVVPEIFFSSGDEARILAAARDLWAGAGRERVVTDLADLRRRVFRPGGSARAAEEIRRFVADGE
jgi:lipid A disaccharide synthetase